ncbi:MAG: hypothetical protein ACR2QL_06000 [Woeseiaceae bacterium]
MLRSGYVANLKPDRRLSHWLAAGVLLAVAAGIWTISNLAISDELRWLGGAGWTLAIAGRAGLVVAAQLRCRQLNIYADGSAMLQDQGGSWQAATLRNGTVVLSNLAWLDLRTDDGRGFSALFCGNCRKSEQWRRLQVIWRHMGSGS